MFAAECQFFPRALTEIAVASMEPPHVRGGMPLRWKQPRRVFVLQWSRRMFAAECQGGAPVAVRCAASMEPPHVRGGMSGGYACVHLARYASMEPPHVRGGMRAGRPLRCAIVCASMEPPHVRGGMLIGPGGQSVCS